VSLLGQQFALADASYQETTQITGGSLLGMMKMASVFSSRARQAEAPATYRVLIHGNRMVRLGPLMTEIVDLDKQTITNIDNQKRQYSVMTFAEMQEAMNRASRKMKDAKGKDGSDQTNGSVTFSAKVKETGATKQIDGRDAKEAVMTLSMDGAANDGSNAKGSMALASDMWLIPDAPGYEEVRNFNVRMAKELAIDVDAGAMMGMLTSQPGASQALADMKKEMSKLSGIPVRQNMRMGMTANGEPLPPPSAADTEASASNQPAPNAGGQSKGGFGGLGALMKRKLNQNSDSSASGSSGSGNGSSSAILLETATQRTNFSADPVDTSSFEPPAGFKQVQSPLARQ